MNVGPLTSVSTIRFVSTVPADTRAPALVAIGPLVLVSRASVSRVCHSLAATEIMFYPAFVCLSVCLFVC